MTRATVRLRLIGPFRVEGPLAAPVPAGKAMRTLAVLAERVGEFVPLGELVDTLWEADPPERADRNIAALVSRLRRALGRERIEGGTRGYRLRADDLTVDLREAAEQVETAERELAQDRYPLASVAAESAARLLAEDVALAGERDDEWLRHLRFGVAHLLRRARICWSLASLELGAHDVAVEAAGAILRADPLDEEACRVLMVTHQRAGRSGAALIAYRRLRQAMAEQLGSDPSPETQAVHLSVLRAEPAVGVRRPATTAGAAGGPDLVGRSAELARLRALWTAAAAGRPGLVLVSGEAGIGKTALVSAFAEEPRRTGAMVLTATCYEAERSLYLQPLVQALTSAVQRLRPVEAAELAGSRRGTLVHLVPELRETVGPVPYERAGPEIEHGRSLDAVAGFLVRLSMRQPVVLTVDDAQHAGRSTLEALHLLASRWAGGRIMVVLAERVTEDERVTEALRDVAAAELALGPLAREDVAALAARAAVRYDPDQLYALTGGSPLFVTELLRHPAAAGAGNPAPVPPSLHGAVRDRIAHAGAETASLLAVAGVLGTAFPLEDLAALAGLGEEECARQAERALRAGLLVTRDGTFHFPNDIVRRVAYESAPEPVRISRHRRAAELLAANPEAAARHLAAARDWTGATRAFAAAAERAHRAFANTEAAELLTQALDTALAAGDPHDTVEVLLRRGRACGELGRLDAARADHERALEVARASADAELEARALEQLGWTALYARDAMQAVDLAEQATELAESAAAAPGALPSAMLLLGRVRHWDGEYAGAEAAYDEALAAEPDETTRAQALAYRGALLQHQDRFAEARSVLARAAVLCRRTGEFRPMLQTLFFTALARGDSGDFFGALRALDNARRLIDTEGVSFYRAGIETTTSWMWQELGQVHRAREHAEQAVELARRGGGALELEQELHALLALADCDLVLGDTDSAGAAVEAAVPMLDRSLPFRPRAAMRLLEMRSRFDPTLAEALRDEARSYSSPKYEALALAALGKAELAGQIAARTGSDLLIAQLGTPAERRAATERIARRLPEPLRASFASAGRLTITVPRTH
jgi:DNA-binding SARP family transcriptional activator